MIAPSDHGMIDTASMTVLLGYEMKSRGTDATGILTVDTKGRLKLRKKPYPADVFLASREGIGCSAQTLLLHTRAATQGRPNIPGNNHPIQHGGIIGIHNGVIWNDDKLFAQVALRGPGGSMAARSAQRRSKRATPAVRVSSRT